MLSWTWGLTIASIIGTVANIYKCQWCFWVWSFTNSTWAIYNFTKGEYPQATLFTVYFGLAVWGLVKWGKGSEG